MKLDEVLRQHRFRAGIFDLDGLLVDTESIGKDVMTQLFQKEFGISLTQEDQKNFYGVPDIICYERLIQKYDVAARPQELLDEHNKIYNKGIGELEEPLPGVREVLQRLQEKNIAMAVCSGSYRDQIMLIMTSSPH